MWQTNLIKLYCAVCDNSSTIEAVTQRQSNNFRPQFSDEECITVYLWGICQRRFEQKTIYKYTKNHLLKWFPKLPSYQAFSDRLNRLAPAFQALAEHWLSVIGVDIHRDCSVTLKLLCRNRYTTMQQSKGARFFIENVTIVISQQSAMDGKLSL